MSNPAINEEINVANVSNIGEPIESSQGKTKYKKPYVLTEARKASLKKAQEKRKEQLAKKKTVGQETTEVLQKQIQELNQKLSSLDKKEHPDNEIVVSRPVKIEKEPNKKDQTFEEFKHEMTRMREMMEKMPQMLGQGMLPPMQPTPPPQPQKVEQEKPKYPWERSSLPIPINNSKYPWER